MTGIFETATTSQDIHQVASATQGREKHYG